MKKSHLNPVIISLMLLNAQTLFAESADEAAGWKLRTGDQNSSIVQDFMQMNPEIMEEVGTALGFQELRKAVETHPTATQLLTHAEGSRVTTSSSALAASSQHQITPLVQDKATSTFRTSFSDVSQVNVHPASYYSERISEAQQSGNSEIEEAWKMVITQREMAPDQWSKSKKTRIRGRSVRLEDVTASTDQAVKMLTNRVDALMEAQKATRAGKNEVAIALRQIAEKLKIVADQWKSSSEAFVQGDEDHAKLLGGNSDSAAALALQAVKALEKSIVSLTKAQEATGAGNKELTAIWREIFKKQKIEAIQWSRASKFYAAKKDEESSQWGTIDDYHDGAANLIQKSAEALEKSLISLFEAQRATAAENEELAVAWCEIFGKQKKEANQWSRASECCAAGNWEELNRLENRINGFISLTQSSIKRLEPYIEKLEKAQKTAATANLSKERLAILRKEQEILIRTYEVEVKINEQLAATHHDIAKQYKRYADLQDPESEVTAVGCLEQKNWNDVSKARSSIASVIGFLMERIDALTKAQEAIVIRNEEMAAAWCQLANHFKTAADQNLRASEAYALGNLKEGDRWGKEGWLAWNSDYFDHASNSIYEASEKLKKRIDVLIEAQKATVEGNQELAAAQYDLAAKLQIAAEQWNRASQAYATGNKEEGERLGSFGAASATEQSIFILKKGIDALVKSQNSERNGEGEVATAWRDFAEQQKEEADQWSGKVEISTTENKKEGQLFEKRIALMGYARNFLEKRIEVLIKAQAFDAEGNQELAAAYRDVAKQQKKEADQFNLVSIDCAVGNQDNRLLSKLAYADEVQGVDGAEKLSVQKLLDASGADISSPSLRDAVETDEARRTKDFDAEPYVSYCSSQNSSPTQHSLSLSQVVVDGDETICSHTGATKQFAAEVEFRKQSNIEVGYLHYRSSQKVIETLEERIDALIKAQNTVTGNEEMATAWRDYAEICKPIAEQWSCASKAYAAGNKEEGDDWNGDDKYFKNKIDLVTSTQRAARSLKTYIEKLIDAEDAIEAGDQKKADKCYEAAKREKRRTDDWSCVSRAYASGNKEEGDNLVKYIFNVVKYY